MNYEKVKLIVDSWVPIDLLYFAPKNEYDFEIKRIVELTSHGDTVDSVGNIIYRVFMESFGENTFQKSIEECVLIAKKIWDILDSISLANLHVILISCCR